MFATRPDFYTFEERELRSSLDFTTRLDFQTFAERPARLLQSLIFATGLLLDFYTFAERT
jgi:hypothetical protein